MIRMIFLALLAGLVGWTCGCSSTGLTDKQWAQIVAVQNAPDPSSALLSVGYYRPAQEVLANYYQHGIDLDLNVDEAEKWYLKVATDNYGNKYVLGRFYEEHQDYEKAFAWYRKAAEKEDKYMGSYKYLLGDQYEKAASQFALSRCYKNGLGVKPDLRKANDWCVSALTSLGDFEGDIDWNGIYPYWQHPIQKCNEDPYVHIALWCKKQADDLSMAADWLARRRLFFGEFKARDDAQGQYALGLCYKLGCGVETNSGKEFEWFTNARNSYKGIATNGWAIIGYELGYFYQVAGKFDPLYGIEKMGDLLERRAKAIEWYLKAAARGKGDAQHRLALMYEEDGETTRAKEWFRKAYETYLGSAQKGGTSAQVALGWCLENGHGVEQNVSEAIEWYRKAAGALDLGTPTELGAAEGSVALGRCYENGIGVEKDEKLAFAWYLRALSYLPDEKAMENLSTAADWYWRAAINIPRYENMEGELRCALGRFYENGTGVAKDFHKAAANYEKSAKLNNARGLYELAHCYEKGIGLKQDIAEARILCGKSAWLGNVKAQLKQLGHPGVPYPIQTYLKSVYAKVGEDEQYLNNLVKQEYPEAQYWMARSAHDAVEAFEWCQKAAEQGYADAQCLLGYFYWNGKGAPVDTNNAMKWFWKAANQGNAYAWYALGQLETNEANVIEANRMAMELYLKEAEQGSIPAMLTVGNFYFGGLPGVDLNQEKGLEWYLKAAEAGDSATQCEVGDWYLLGKRGLDIQPFKATQWYQKAAESGNSKAQYALGVCLANGTGCANDFDKAVFWCRKAAECDNSDAKAWMASNFVWDAELDACFQGGGEWDKYGAITNLSWMSIRQDSILEKENENNTGLIEWKTKVFPSFLANAPLERIMSLVMLAEKGMLKLDRDATLLKSQMDQAARFVPDSRKPYERAPEVPKRGEEIAKFIDQRKMLLANIVSTAKKAMTLREP